MIREDNLLFRLECERRIPKYIRVDGISYRLHCIKQFHIISYVEYDGEKNNYNKQLPKSYYHNHEMTSSEAIDKFINRLQSIHYEVLDEIVSRDKTFLRELTELINKYSKENDSNTPDYILAEYMINALNAFNIAKNTIDERNARG